MRREWGSIVVRNGRPHVQFVKADGNVTMRRLYRPKRKWNAEIEDIRAEVEREKAGIRPVEPQRARVWIASVYGPVLRSRVAASTVRSAEVHFGRLVAWLEERGDPTLDRVTRADAENFAASLHEEGLAPAYVARLVRTLRSAWDAAVLRGVARENVWRGLKTGRIPARQVPWVAPEDLRRMCRAVNAAQRPLVTLLGETALRIGETLALRWDDVDLDRRVLHVRKGKTEAARRSVELTTPAVDVLRRLKREAGDDELVFRTRTTQGVRSAIAAACKRARVPVLTSHLLRHVAASHLVQGGIAPSTVAAILGHADGGVLVMRLYGRWMPRDAQRAAMDRLEEFRRGRGGRRAKRGKPRG